MSCRAAAAAATLLHHSTVYSTLLLMCYMSSQTLQMCLRTHLISSTAENVTYSFLSPEINIFSYLLLCGRKWPTSVNILASTMIMQPLNMHWGYVNSRMDHNWSRTSPSWATTQQLSLEMSKSLLSWPFPRRKPSVWSPLRKRTVFYLSQ